MATAPTKGPTQELAAIFKIQVSDGGPTDLNKLREYTELVERLTDGLDRYNAAVGKTKAGGGMGVTAFAPGGGGPGRGGGGPGGGGWSGRPLPWGGFGPGPGGGGPGGPYPQYGFGGQGRLHGPVYEQMKSGDYGHIPWGNENLLPEHLQTMRGPPPSGPWRNAAGMAWGGLKAAGNTDLTPSRALLGQAFGRVAVPWQVASAWAGGENASSVVQAAGGNRGDQNRAFLNSNWLTRQGLGVIDTFSGRDSFIKIEQLNAERDAVRAERERSLGRKGMTGQFDIDLENQRMPIRSQIAAYARDRRTAAFGYIDPGTVGGETRLRETTARQPIATERIDLERQRLALGFEGEGKDAQLDRNAKERDALLRRQSTLSGEQRGGNTRLGGVGDAERVKAAKELEQIGKDLVLNEERQKKLAAERQEINKEIVANQRQQRENKLKLVELEKQELDQRAAKAEGQAGNIGGMGPMNRQFAIQAAMMVKETDDIDTLPPEVLQAAESVVPGEMQKRRVKKGEATGELKFLQEQFPDEYRDKLGDVRKQAQAKGNEAINLKFEIAEQFQKDLDKFVFADKFIAMQRRAMEQMFNDMFNAVDQRQRANQVK